MDEYKNTIDYYNINAKNFVSATIDVEFENMQKNFLSKLPIHADILDFGCGSGRDIKYFLEQGYNVEAVDGSKALSKLAGECTGIEVKNMFFQELSEEDKYDGIWASFSILHLPIDELADNKLWKLLIDKGMTKTEMRKAAGISFSSLAKLGKGENVTTDVLLSICEMLG